MCILKQTLTDAMGAGNVTRCQISVTGATSRTMPDSSSDPAARIRRAWQRLSPLPGGRVVFSWLVGLLIPYTGTIQPTVLVLEPGFARVQMRDRRRVRNHLRSIHAVALCNLAEFASGLAMTAGLAETVRGIVLGITIEYTKKARGTLIAECRCDPPVISARTEYPVTAVVRDASGDTVATATVRWMLDHRGG
jgi:acyl-coenzyme A thioesterase PaaI-like protein